MLALRESATDLRIAGSYQAALNLWHVACNPWSGGFDIVTFVLIAFAFVGVAFVAVWCDRPHK